MLFLLILALVGVGYVLVNVGSPASQKVSFEKVALSMVIVCVLVYLCSPVLAPLATWLMQVGQNLK